MHLTKEQLAEFGIELTQTASLEASGIQISTSDIRPGDMFIAAKGAKHHGIEYLDSAIAKGAIAVLTNPGLHFESSIPVLLHSDPRSIAGELAAVIYGTNKYPMRLFGVTGTNGKTSTVTYLHQLLNSLGVSAGLSASTKRIVGDQSIESELTSPEAPKLHQMLSQMRAAGQTDAAIEVSAHALEHGRIGGIQFQCVGFTNLSRDHLDDFGDMDNYLATKSALFMPKFAKRAVVMIDDEYGQRLARVSGVPLATLGQTAGDYLYAYDAGDLKLTFPDGKKLVVGFAAGELMARNFALAITMLAESGFEFESLRQAAPSAQQQVPGRLERVSGRAPAVYVDYAHTPDGVSAAVQELSKRYSWLTVVLGASGNRDVGKRGPMAKAAKPADLLVITDQHPRDEEPEVIRRALMDAAENKSLIEIAEPAAAIRHAIANTPESGVVLWCGPGNLKYREISGQKVPFDAREIAREILEEK
ncbi:MAG: UDP-N-acetylmuramoyl-L-alanyl-D-glutamate--2,6-diaminopimelate ligase [Aquiluna sp.]|nr:UDP-N-acetylmuramoyl-L-alanyl-D-glutamate--2,6-diaminopimelate ligase [Aquiluna sp.]MCF8544956.1 UDP-N-acetylmuramoyl-L-alanyl-D-glutamate--2,6-diaminopimelate ligase [Aquiluna sp.]